MKLLEFGMKNQKSRNIFKKLLAKFCLKLVQIETSYMEKQIEKEHIDVPESEMDMQAFFNKIQEDECRSK